MKKELDWKENWERLRTERSHNKRLLIEMSNKQKIVTLVTNIITGILGALAGFFGAN